MNKTVWAGRRADAVSILSSHIPVSGECATPALETYRRFSNLYFSFHRGEFDQRRFGPTHVMLCGKFGIEYRAHSPREADLEQIVDLVIDAALEEIGTVAVSS